MRFLRRAALMLPLLALGCEGPLLSASLEVPKFGLFLAAKEIGGTPAAGTINEEFELDIGSQLDLDQPGATYELRLTELRLGVVTDPAPDLSNVQSVELYSFPATGGAPVLLASYTRDPANPSPTSLRVKGNGEADLLPMIASGLFHLSAEIVTDGPTPPFTADIEAVFYMRLQLDYLEAMDGA